MPEICLRYAWDIPELCLRIAWDITEFCTIFAKNVTEWLSEWKNLWLLERLSPLKIECIKYSYLQQLLRDPLKGPHYPHLVIRQCVPFIGVQHEVIILKLSKDISAPRRGKAETSQEEPNLKSNLKAKKIWSLSSPFMVVHTQALT